MARSLYIPVHLHAKLVRPGNLPVKPPNLMGPVFTAPDGEALADGVHLHWALPDALTNGHIDDNGQLCFPALPDRWIIIRFASVASTAPTPGNVPAVRSCKAFELDAKVVGNLQPLGTLPFSPNRDTRWLTALGLLDEGKAVGQNSTTDHRYLEAAYYATAKGRFGCHDTLADLGAADWNTLNLSYLVIGHYTASTEDPLARVGDELARQKWLDNGKLHLDEPEVFLRQRSPLNINALTPQRAVNQSSVHFIDLQGTPSELGSRASTDTLSALGGSPPNPKLTSLLQQLATVEEQSEMWRRRLINVVGNEVLAIAPIPEDTDGVPSRIVCHGSVVNIDPNGTLQIPNQSTTQVNTQVKVVDSLNAAIDHSLSGVGGAEFLSLLREGLDGDVSSTAGRQALGHLLHASSFDGAPEVPSTPQYDYVLTIRDFDGTPPTAMPSLPPTTPIRIVDRRALPDPEIPLGIVAANLTSFITALGPSARTQLDAQLRVHPRWYRAASPVLQITNAGRCFRHGHDGRMRADGKLLCRAGGQAVAGLTLAVKDYQSTRKRLVGADLVKLGMELSLEPAFVRELIFEHALLDPTNAQRAAALWLIGAYSPTQTAADEAFKAFLEATQGRWAAADPTLGTTPPVASGFTGTLPVPFATTPWTDPWLPLFADIDYEFKPQCDNASNVSLGEIDTILFGSNTPTTPIKVVTREVLSSALPTSLGSALRRLSKELSTTPTQAEKLDEIVRGLAYLDLMTLGFGELDPAIRSQGRAFRGGELRINKLKLVDAFGAVRELVSPNAPHDCTLPPRLTHWARVQSRFTRADAPITAIAPEADAVNSPVAGYLVYDAIEHALEFFNQSGASLGQLRHHRQTNEVLWEGSPSRTQVSSISHPVLSVIDQALRAEPVAPSTQTALLAALNLFSNARLSVAPHHATDDHLAMLCGRPIVVLRLRLELQLTGIGPNDQPAPGNVVLPDKVKVRLGSADQMDDGLLGFFLQGSDGWHLHVDSRHAQKTWESNQDVHSVIEKNTTLELVPNVPREVILLLDGISAFHVTTGLLPRKRIDPSELLHSRIVGKLLPTLQVGPVLFGEGTRRIATTNLPNRKWSFVEKAADGAFTVTSLESFAPALYELPDAPLRIGEGWLRLDKVD